MQQWITALERIAATSPWGSKNRFDSFAPIRLNVAAQWLVDGVSVNYSKEHQWLISCSTQRDYFWNLSRALLLAKETVYIHDWWLSPGAVSHVTVHPPVCLLATSELQMRRPGKPNYRLDHLLERKAKEGVKVFVII